MNIVRLLGLALLVVAVLGCQRDNKTPETVHPERAPDPHIQNSIEVTPASPRSAVGNDGFSIDSEKKFTLKKAALGKAFLLSPTIVIASNEPIIDHLAPKIVSFELSGNKLGLFELNKDAVYKNLRSDRLLETFDIIASNEETITFSWKYGLSVVPFSSLFSGGATDFPVMKFDTSTSPVLNANKVFIRSASIVDGQLEIEQVSQVVAPNLPLTIQSPIISLITGSGITQTYESITVKLNFNLRPYRPNEKFAKRPSPFNDGIGPFETAVVREGSGAVDYLSSIWDLRPEAGPLTYAITKGVPAKYLPAIREGILYWNKVAGREIIKVTTDADPEATPKDRVVLVHWIPWDQAGFARASLQTDPLTGEILRADVYLTSAFAEGSAVTYRRVLENHRSELTSARAIVANGFQPASLCQYHRSPLADAVAQESMGSDHQALDSYVADHLRLVTAHEVGHTLGMRHNFAGSLETELKDPAEQAAVEKKYLSEGLSEGKRVSSSVMDYVFGVPGGLLGSFIKNNALTYDETFIAWAYNNGQVPSRKAAPAFCSDGIADTITGCRRGDSGVNTIASSLKTLKESKRTLENTVLHNIVMLFYPKNPKDKMSKWQIMAMLAKVDLQVLAERRSQELSVVRGLLTDKAEDYSVELSAGKRGWFNESAYDSAIAAKIASELSSVGGVDGFISSLYPMNEGLTPRKGWLKNRLLEIYNRPDFKKGKTLEGVDYQLSEEESAFIADLINGFADKAEEAWLRAVVSPFIFAAPKENDESNSPLDSLMSTSESGISALAQQEQWWPKLAQLAENILTMRSGEKQVKIGDLDVKLPLAAFDVELRKKVIALAVPDNYRLHSLEKTNLKNAKSKILAALSQVLGKEIKSSTEAKDAAKQFTLDLETRKWLKQELSVLSKVESESF